MLGVIALAGILWGCGAEVAPPSVPLDNNATPEIPATQTLTIFVADAQCLHLVPRTARIPWDARQGRFAEMAIAQVLAQQSINNFLVEKVDVSIENRIASINFVLEQSSPRRLVSLSSCEQFALLRAIHRTLTENKQLNVTNVRFLESGQNVYQ